MEKENIKTVTIEDFKNSQHILDYIDDDFAIEYLIVMRLSDWSVSLLPFV